MRISALKVALFLSLGIHMAFLGLYTLKQSQEKRTSVFANQQKEKTFEIKFLPVKQIVESAKSMDKAKSRDSFLGKEDAHFERETVAKVIDTFRISKGQANKLEKLSGKNSAQQNTVQKNRSSASTLAKLGLGLPMLAQQKKVEHKKESSDESLLREVSSLASASNDYIKDIPLGDMSKLNTTEYKHFGFFQRIRSQLEQHWGSTLKDTAKKIYRKGRAIASESDFITNLEVELDQQGKIVGIRIIGTSGIKELDDAAIESFNKAGPFPNPPQDLVINGQAVIKWGFVVKS